MGAEPVGLLFVTDPRNLTNIVDGIQTLYYPENSTGAIDVRDVLFSMKGERDSKQAGLSRPTKYKYLDRPIKLAGLRNDNISTWETILDADCMAQVIRQYAQHHIAPRIADRETQETIMNLSIHCVFHDKQDIIDLNAMVADQQFLSHSFPDSIKDDIHNFHKRRGVEARLDRRRALCATLIS